MICQLQPNHYVNKVCNIYHSVKSNNFSVFTLAVDNLSIALNLSVLSCLAFMSLPAQATDSIHSQNSIVVYKTIGEHGEAKFSQFAPTTDKPVEILHIRRYSLPAETPNSSQHTRYAHNAKAPLAEPVSTQDNQALNVLSYRPNSTKPTSESTHAQVMDTQCQTLQQNLDNLNAGGHIYQTDAAGIRTYLSAYDIQRHYENTQSMLAQYC